LEAHAVVILALVEEQPDATYEEILAALAARQIKSSRGSLWRFFARLRNRTLSPIVEVFIEHARAVARTMGDSSARHTADTDSG
jgi:hypothetical protein